MRSPSLGLVIAVAAGACNSGPPPDCDEVVRRSVRDSGGGPVSIYVTTDSPLRIPESSAIAIGSAIASNFERPVIRQYPILGTWVMDRKSAFFGVTGAFSVVWRRDGRVTHPTVTATTLLPDLDSSVVRAISALATPAADRSIPRPFADSIRLTVRLNHTETPPISVPLYAERFARRNVTRTLRDPKGNSHHTALRAPAPTPSDTGFVTLWFVVDERGRVNPRTVQVLRPGSPAMMAAIPPFVLTGQYRPAEIDGCPVATHVVRRVDFR